MLTTENSPRTTGSADPTAYNVQRTAYGFVFVLLLCGVLQALWFRRTLNPDGVAYLDLSDDVLAGRWSALVQGYWSPLYPVLLAAARTVAGQGGLHETAIAHAVSLAGFAFALGGWHLVLRQVARHGGGLVAFATPLGVAAGYAVFAWAMLWLASLHFVTPDLWLAGWIFVAAALVLRHGDGTRVRVPLALGAALGAGYLTKSVLFPVAPFFIAGAVLLSPTAHRLRVALFACLAFGAVAGPWVAAISAHEGRLTFGDNGRFNYAWFVTGDRWLSPDPVRETGAGAAVFPRVVEVPATYAWPNTAGTYAPWRDPSSWHGGMTGRFDAQRQKRVLATSWGIYAFYLTPWVLFLIVLFAAGVRPAGGQARRALALIGPSMVGLVGYALVFVEGRYIAPFLALILVAIPLALRAPEAGNPRRLALAVVLGVVLWVVLGIRIPSTVELACGLVLAAVLVWRGTASARFAAFAGAAMITLGGMHVLFRSGTDAARLAAGETMIDPALMVRAALAADLFPEGRRIGIIGDGPTSAVWARPLRASIVAELPASQAAAFWTSSDEVHMAIVHAMRAAGAREIVASGVLPASLPAGWQRASTGAVARYALDEP